jgi:dTMP kinase
MPLFISFEGPDGSGKSTQARLLAETLRERGFRVTETREPGGTPLGERIRELVLNPSSPRATPLAMALLLSAARAQLVSDVIAPALKSGNIVIADRFADSTLAYQSFGLGLDAQVTQELARIATAGLRPDAVVYVDVPPEVGLGRIAGRGERNRLDAEAKGFHEQVRRGYHELARADPGRWLRIDGAASPEDVHRAVVEAIEPFLPRLASPV